MHDAKGMFMAEAIVMMGLMTAFSAVFAVRSISCVRANEYFEFAGAGCASARARKS